MKISVIIPIFNEEAYIRKCLESLKRQTETPYEIIVVDNNCTDRSIEYAQKFGVKIIKETNQGMIYARNAGFNAAAGDIIARCDADTVVSEDWISQINKNFKKAPIAGLTGMVIFYDSWLLKRVQFIYYFYFVLMRFFLKHNVFAGPNMVLTKKIWEKVKNEVCMDEKKVHEDIDLSIHIARYGQIAFDPELKVYSSSRRIKYNPLSFFFEYPLRLISTLNSHQRKN